MHEVTIWVSHAAGAGLVMIRRWLAGRAWVRGEPVYVTDPDGAVVQLPEADEHGMVSGEDLEAFLAGAGICVEEWLQMGIRDRERRIRRVFAVSAVAGVVGVVLVLFGGWSSVVGALVAAVAVVACGWAVALKRQAARQGR